MAKEMDITLEDAKRAENFFRRLKPMLYAIEPYNKQMEYFDVYILSTAQWSNQNALVEKMNVVRGLEGPQHQKTS